jgi:hypothetical protein
MLSVPPLVKFPTTASSPWRCARAMATTSFSSRSALGNAVGSSPFSDRYAMKASLITPSAAGPGS